ncbi:MAG: hypothetical protein JNJ88_01750 [Planctomycetes bacterium]|nr:hypothetical protein [Planctomycetota bacterium]
MSDQDQDSRHPASKPEWTLSEERQFVENILCQRFNYLLIVYSLVAAAAFGTESQMNLRLTLTSGAVICTMTLIPLARAQFKLDLIIEHMTSKMPGHPVFEVERWSVDSRNQLPVLFRPMAGASRRRWIGYWIPGACSALLCVAAALAWLNIITPK